MRLSTGAFEEMFPEVDHLRFRSRLPNATDTDALPVRAARRSPEMLPVIRPDNGSSGREVPDLRRSLFKLFAARGAFVTGFMLAQRARIRAAIQETTRQLFVRRA